MIKCCIADSVNYWKEYEKTKNKEIIDFSKNKEMERKFLKLVEKLKIKEL